MSTPKKYRQDRRSRRELGPQASRLLFGPPFPCVLLLALCLAGCGGSSAPSGEDTAPAAIVRPEADATELDVYDEIGGDFTLTDQQGRPFRLADSHGRIRLLFFGYAMCPDVCPMTLSKVVQIRQLLGEDRDELLPLFVSVDPERDTPERLRAFLGYFDLGETVALTGARDEIDAVVDLFKATYEREEADAGGHYVVNHTSYLFLIDRQGRVRGLFGVSEKMGEIVSAIRALLVE